MTSLDWLFSLTLVAATIPLAKWSVRAAAWYWGMFAGAGAAGLAVASLHLTNLTIAVPLSLGIWLGPIAALRLRRRRPQTAPLAGERLATPDDLAPHEISGWPEPGPYLSAGAWAGARRSPGPDIAVYGTNASKEGRHALLVVPTGLGKGLWTTTQLLTWNGGAIVNDLKSDTYPRTAGWRSTIGPVYVINAQAPVHRFDPTANARNEEDLRPLAHAVCSDPQDRDPYWAQYAARILLVLMLAARRSNRAVFPFVAQAVGTGPSRALDAVAAVDRDLADRVRPHGDSRGFTSAWETLATRCESLLSPSTLATLSGSDFTAADLLRKRATLYLQIPEARLDDLRPFLRLVWTSLIMQLVTESDRLNAGHPPLLIILDEAGRTPFAGLPEFLVTLRSRHMSCAVLIQALSQLRAAYGQQADVILGNASIHIYARTEDLDTAKYLSERLGTAEEILPTTSTNYGPHGASKTHGQLRRFRPLASAQRIRTMQDQTVLAFLPTCPPAVLTRMDWRDHPELRRRTEQAAPVFKPIKPAPPLTHVEATGYVEPD